MKSMHLCHALAGRTLLSTCLIAVAGAAMAQSSLTDADLKTLVVGKTVDFKSLVNGRTGAGYFAPDGRYTLRFDNGMTVGKRTRKGGRNPQQGCGRSSL